MAYLRTPLSSHKRRRRENGEDAIRSEQNLSFSLDDFDFEEIVSQCGPGGLYLIKYQAEQEQENVMTCVSSEKSSIQQVKETELVEAQQAVDHADRVLQLQVYFLEEAAKKVAETKANLGIAKALLKRAHEVKSADEVEPENYTVSTVEAICNKIHPDTWIQEPIETLAKKLKFDSVEDIANIPHKSPIIRLLKFAQKSFLWKNPHFKAHMQKLIDDGVFHKNSFDTSRVIYRNTLTDESAREYAGIVFKVQGYASRRDHSEANLKFVPRFLESDPSCWCTHWVPSAATPSSTTTATPSSTTPAQFQNPQNYGALSPYTALHPAGGVPQASAFLSPMANSVNAGQASFESPYRSPVPTFLSVQQMLQQQQMHQGVGFSFSVGTYTPQKSPGHHPRGASSRRTGTPSTSNLPPLPESGIRLDSSHRPAQPPAEQGQGDVVDADMHDQDL